MSDRMIVKKSEELVLAKNTWTELEGKVFATLLKELNPKNERDFRPMSITVDEIQNLWGSELNTSRLRKLCYELKRKSYEIPELDNKGKIKAYDYYSLFSHIRYETKSKVIHFEFDKSMSPHLLEFNRFVKYDIENILKFKSKYSMPFYELFKIDLFKKEALRKKTLTLDEMTVWLQLPKSLQQYNQFKTKVLDIVSADLKTNSDIYFVYEPKKDGKKVVAVEFTFFENVKTVERNLLFNNDELESEFEQYYGKSFAYKGYLYEHIKCITPLGNENLYRIDTDTYSIKFQDLKQLEKMIQAYEKGTK